MKDKLKKQLEMLKKSSKIDAMLERGDIEEQALLNSSEDLRPADESHTFELLESSKERMNLLSRTGGGSTRRPAFHSHARRSAPKTRSKPKPKPQKKRKSAKKPAKKQAKKRRR